MALDARAEKFCECIVKGMTQRDAYKEAYPDANPSSAAVMANKLRKKPEIMARIEDIKTTVRGDTNTTIHSIIDELEDARQVARRDNKPVLMMRASMLKAQMLGFLGQDSLGAGLDAKSTPQLSVDDLKAFRDVIIGEANEQ